MRYVGENAMRDGFPRSVAVALGLLNRACGVVIRARSDCRDHSTLRPLSSASHKPYSRPGCHHGQIADCNIISNGHGNVVPLAIATTPS